ncbi:hypothetical protein VTI28DRAFT_1763 [Corynascus sepedonium]
MINDWTDTCTPHLTTAITTPAGVTLTETFDEPTCQALFNSCGSNCSAGHHRWCFSLGIFRARINYEFNNFSRKYELKISRAAYAIGL